MRVPTPNEIEIVLGLPTNSLSISFSEHGVTFDPSLSSSEEKIVLKLLEGIDDEWVAERLIIPNWVGFNAYISFDSNMINYEAVANTRHPSIVGKKDLTYSMILEHGIDNFALIFPAFCQIAEVSQWHRNQWADTAEFFNLPTEFVNVIRGN